MLINEKIFAQLIQEWEKDPVFNTEEVLLYFTEQICQLMEKKGIDRAELARRLGTSRAYITKLLNGYPNLTLQTMVKIALALDEKIEINFSSFPKFNIQNPKDADYQWVMVDCNRTQIPGSVDRKVIPFPPVKGKNISFDILYQSGKNHENCHKPNKTNIYPINSKSMRTINMESLLHLETFHLLHLSFDINEDFNPENRGEVKYTTHINFNIFQSPDRLLFKIPFEFSMKSKSNKTQYKVKKLKIKIEGIFSFPEETQEEIIKQYIPFNALAILYGIARGIVAGVTGSSYGGSFILPTINLYKLLSKTQKENEQNMTE